MKRLFGWLVLLMVSAGLSCSDNNVAEAESDDSSGVNAALLTFDGSGCKKEQGDLGVLPLYRLVSVNEADGADSARFAGLQCVSWREEENLLIDLVNFHQACGIEVVGTATVAESGTLWLTAHNSSCAVANCGWCTYDWSYSIALDSMEAGSNAGLNVEISSDAYPADLCSDGYDPEATQYYQLSIPFDQRAVGMACTLQHYYALQDFAMSTNVAGQRMMPCRGENLGYTDPDTAPCDAGLDCVAPEDNSYEICLETCAADIDCTYPDMFHCDQGHCVLTDNQSF